jgi:CrcB protein
MAIEWNMITAVAVGGGTGAVLRYGLAGVVHQWTGEDFPYGTLVVNVLGSLLLGFIVQVAEMKAGPAPWMKLFLTVGLCGGFTTFSTFSLESFRLLQDGSYLLAAGNVAGSVLLCLFGIWAGMVLARMI